MITFSAPREHRIVPAIRTVQEQLGAMESPTRDSYREPLDEERTE